MRFNSPREALNHGIATVYQDLAVVPLMPVWRNFFLGNEFIYIIAAVVGGCLLTGGYGSAVGAAIGALIFGMVNQGIVYAGWNPYWFTFFVGALLLGAILLNNWVRKLAEAMR